MATGGTHNKIIAREAAAVLAPLGVTRKGRSRLWLDDQFWYVILIEFQPSSWSRGTYLNVGVNWLWHPQEHWSFDIGYRKLAHAEFRTEEQFTKAVSSMVAYAGRSVTELRCRLSSLRSAYVHVAETYEAALGYGCWPELHLGVLGALAGDRQLAVSLLRTIIAKPARFDWQAERALYVEEVLAILDNAGDIKDFVEKRIGICRRMRGLPTRGLSLPA